MHRYARFAYLPGGLTALVVLLAVALLATSAQATPLPVFSDDFENDTIGSNPVNPDIGLPWDNEKSPGVTVIANPYSAAGGGNTSTKVLSLLNKGEMDGNFGTGIAFQGAQISTDFYIRDDATVNKITMKFRTAAGVGPFNLNLKQNGEVTGGSAVGTLAITHYGTNVWQNATWSFDYTGTGDLWDVDLAFTNLATSATKSNTFKDIELAGAISDVFTEVTPRGQGGGTVLVDNIQVVPEPSTGLLLTLGLTALSFRRRHTPRP